MSESALHTDLVRSLVAWVTPRIGTDCRSAIFVDLPEGTAGDRPPSIDGFFPDLYCADGDGSPMFLGEAKTARDLESHRSREQLAGYLRFLAVRQRGALVLAVPWRVVPAARSLIRALQRLNAAGTVMTHFLEKLPG